MFTRSRVHVSSHSADFTPTEAGAIHAQGVEMAFQSGKQSFPVLKSINWEIPKGNIQLLMGPSGSGKTTLAGLLTPAAGNIYLLDQEITSMSRSKRTQFRQRNIGFIFQNFNLFPALTVAENVEVVLNLKGIRAKKALPQARCC